MIKSHQYVLDSEWSEAQPSADGENDFLERHGWDDYGQWHLALDSEGSKETKDRYNFPCGDFRRIHYCSFQEEFVTFWGVNKEIGPGFSTRSWLNFNNAT